MKKVRDKLSSLVIFIRSGPFAGNHTPARYDDHVYQAAGDETATTYSGQDYDAEDSRDQYLSAMADRERDIAYWSGMGY
jgi:hypothetical protein